MSNDIYQNLQQLGGKTELPESPEKAIIESVQNPQADVDYVMHRRLLVSTRWHSN